MADLFKNLSNTISVDRSDANRICVNGEWTFVLPKDIKYTIDGQYDNGIEGSIDLSGTTKPIVFKKICGNTGYEFNFELSPHMHLFNNYNTIIECKYDNRFNDPDSIDKQTIIKDDPDFYIDLIAVSLWILGTEVSIRIRGENITAYNITGIVRTRDADDFKELLLMMKSIADSIQLLRKSGSFKSRTLKKTNRSDSSKNVPSDKNCIIDETVLQKYIGRDQDIILPEGLTEIADNTFSGLRIKTVVVPEGVTKIGSRVFENCFDLEKVDLPSTLKELGDYSFVDCHKLKNIKLSKKLAYISSSLFSECFELDNLTIPKSVKRIDAFAFKNCRKFTSITIPEKVESIGFSAFANCINLEYLYIPASVNEIDDNFIGSTPFDGCNNMIIHCPAGSFAEKYCVSHGIRFEIDNTVHQEKKTESQRKKSVASSNAPNNNKEYNLMESFSDSQSEINLIPDKKTQRRNSSVVKYDSEVILKKLMEMDETEKSDFRIIGSSVYKYKGSSEFVKIPNGITNICDEAFKGNKKVVGILIPDSVVKIDHSAFENCKKLMYINFPESLVEINNNAFHNCNSLVTIKMPDSLRQLSGFSGCSSLREVQLNHGLKSIDSFAFSECSQLEYIDIPETVTDIGSYAFYCCSKIKTITLPKAVKVIKESVFSGCKMLEEICLDESVREIGNNAFYSCSRLLKIKLPDGLKKIGEDSFMYSGLTEILIPSGITTIKKGTFSGCEKLKRVILPDTLITIEENAFSHCKILEELIISEGVTNIEFKDPFLQYQSKLVIRIPETVVNIKGLDTVQASSINRFVVYKGTPSESILKKSGFKYSSIKSERQKELEKREKEKANLHAEKMILVDERSPLVLDLKEKQSDITLKKKHLDYLDGELKLLERNADEEKEQIHSQIEDEKNRIRIKKQNLSEEVVKKEKAIKSLEDELGKTFLLAFNKKKYLNNKLETESEELKIIINSINEAEAEFSDLYNKENKLIDEVDNKISSTKAEINKVSRLLANEIEQEKLLDDKINRINKKIEKINKRIEDITP